MTRPHGRALVTVAARRCGSQSQEDLEHIDRMVAPARLDHHAAHRPPRASSALSMIDPTAFVHPSVDLEDDVSIGPDTSVWHRAHLRRGARIGAGCIVGRDTYIDEYVVIGDRVKIQNAALVYHGVTVDDGVFIGPNAVLTNDRFPRAITLSGNLARPEDWAIGSIRLHRGSSIGAGAVVVAGNDVGEFATLGAGAIVTRSVPDHALVAGNPARRIGWVCACGHRLGDRRGHPYPGDGIGEAVCQACGSVFEIVGDRCVVVKMGVGR